MPVFNAPAPPSAVSLVESLKTEKDFTAAMPKITTDDGWALNERNGIKRKIESSSGSAGTGG